MEELDKERDQREGEWERWERSKKWTQITKVGEKGRNKERIRRQCEYSWRE